MLMTERDPWVFAILVCYVLSCFGGGFAIMPSLVIDIYGPKRMSRFYGIMLTAWSAAGILGPLMIASLKDNYPDRVIVYSFLLGILVLAVGFSFTFLINDERFIPRRILLQAFAARRCATPKNPRKVRPSRWRHSALPQSPDSVPRPDRCRGGVKAKLKEPAMRTSHQYAPTNEIELVSCSTSGSHLVLSFLVRLMDASA
jgi:MFS family permease